MCVGGGLRDEFIFFFLIPSVSFSQHSIPFVAWFVFHLHSIPYDYYYYSKEWHGELGVRSIEKKKSNIIPFNMLRKWNTMSSKLWHRIFYCVDPHFIYTHDDHSEHSSQYIHIWNTCVRILLSFQQLDTLDICVCVRCQLTQTPGTVHFVEIRIMNDCCSWITNLPYRQYLSSTNESIIYWFLYGYHCC